MLILHFVLAASENHPCPSTSCLQSPVFSVPVGFRDVRVYTTSIAVAEEIDSLDDEISDEIELSRNLDVESL